MITTLRIANLRAISDSGDIDLRRINVLVGRNSSGKSSILRSLPLLKQSVEQQTKGPFLWYGRLVDFGDFPNAARDGDVARGISFEYGITFASRRPSLFRPAAKSRDADAFLIPARNGLRAKVSISLGRSDSDRVGHIREMSLTVGSDDIRIGFDEEGEVQSVVVMNEVVQLSSQQQWWVSKGKVIPSIVLLEQETYDDDDRIESFWEPVDRPFHKELIRVLQGFAHGNTSYEHLDSIAKRLQYGEEGAFYDHVSKLVGVAYSFKSRISQLTANAPEIRALRRVVLLTKLASVLRAADAEITAFAKSVRYVEPVRATAERYYRDQDLAVDEIDSRGTNTAMYLSSLQPAVLENLQEWMLENFGFVVSVESNKGHVQVKISEGGGPLRNIADLGFGYSQVLPIVLQLWHGISGDPFDSEVTLAIEQPELHLHPHYQAKIADAIAASAKGSARVFVETHSDHFVNRLGALISEGALSQRDMQVIVVSEVDAVSSRVEVVKFSADGQLGANWPSGFFTPSVS